MAYLGDTITPTIGDIASFKEGYNIRKTPNGDIESKTTTDYIREILAVSGTWYRTIDGWLSASAIKEIVKRENPSAPITWWEALSKSIGNAIGGVNVNVPANVTITAPKSVEVDVFSSLKRNAVPITVGVIAITALVVGVAYATRRRK